MIFYRLKLKFLAILMVLALSGAWTVGECLADSKPKHENKLAEKDKTKLPQTQSKLRIIKDTPSDSNNRHKRHQSATNPNQESIAGKKSTSLDFDWPIKGKVLKRFSTAHNKGIDIAGKKGQPVKSAEAGKVVYDGQGLRGFGKLLIIKHNAVYLSAYANNSRLLVKEGQLVKKGQVIAEVGNVGSKRASLHFEIRKNGKPVNPLNLMPIK